MENLKDIHRIFIGFQKRAERSSDSMLVASFVDSAPLLDILSTPNNQVIYGRRGTGKTHALKFLAEQVDKKGDHSIYLDLRSVGSNGSIYSDAGRPLTERASTLLVDVLNGLYDEFFRLALAKIDRHPNPDEVTRRLDALQAALTSVEIEGQMESEAVNQRSSKSLGGISAALGIGPTQKTGVAAKASAETQTEMSVKVRKAGREVIRLSFGNIYGSICNIIDLLQTQRIWLLIDEWSEIPVELQPYLADLIRRTLLPINQITIKIAAIEHRTSFSLLRERGEYTGLELGADISADLNLDDFLVFDNDQEKSTQFVKILLFKHYNSREIEAPEFDDADQLIQATFTQYPAFEEFVRAVEGVPRDALNLAAKIATKAFGDRVAMQHVRAAARDWYSQDKVAAIKNNIELNNLLAFIVDQVIGERRARAFLFPSNYRLPSIEKLFDARLLHILKKNISAHDQPGVRFDVYKIDYGCYVDMISTTKAPQGLFRVNENDEYIEVPRDDYRSIRRAILMPQDIPVFDDEGDIGGRESAS